MHENHGGWYYEMQELGYNYRLTDFQAALGTSQLKRANEGLIRRTKIASDLFCKHLKPNLIFLGNLAWWKAMPITCTLFR
jgi:dTDP-4-amino-4,6-dideoxygalactose transaminase